MTFRAVIAAAIAFLPAAAQADQIALTAPMQAASLHEGGIDMVVYYLPRAGHFEVVATYVTGTAPGTGPAAPRRLRMGLAEGDATRFSLPGQAQVTYSFARHGDRVEVEAKPEMSAEVRG